METLNLSLIWPRSSGGVVYERPPHPTDEERERADEWYDQELLTKVWNFDHGQGRYVVRPGQELTQQYTVESPFDPLALRFVAARDQNSMARFLSTYGLPVDPENEGIWAPGYPSSDVPAIAATTVELYRNSVAYFLFHAETPENADNPAAWFNEKFAQIESAYKLTPRFEYRGNKRHLSLTVSPRSLFAFMVMEVAIIAARGIEITRCEICGTPRISGFSTNRKNPAKTCSAKCRQAKKRALDRGDELLSPPPLYDSNQPISRLADFLDSKRQAFRMMEEIQAKRRSEMTLGEKLLGYGMFGKHVPLSEAVKLPPKDEDEDPA